MESLLDEYLRSRRSDSPVYMRTPVAAGGPLTNLITLPLAFASAPGMVDENFPDAALASEAHPGPAADPPTTAVQSNAACVEGEESDNTPGQAVAGKHCAGQPDASPNDDPLATGSSSAVDSSDSANSHDESMAGHRIHHFLGIRSNDDGKLTRSASASPSTRRASNKIANLRAAFERRDDNGRSAAVPVSIQVYEKDQAKVVFDDQAGEIKRLREKLQAEMESRSALEAKCLRLEEQVQGLQGQLELQRRQHRDDVAKLSTRDPEHSEKEAFPTKQDTTQQLSELKRSISVATRMHDQITDTALAQDLATLHHELQNWTVNQFRRAKLRSDFDKLDHAFDEDRQHHFALDVGDVKALVQNVGMVDKLATLQTIAISSLMAIFQAPLLFGLPQVKNSWHANMLATLEGLSTILPPPALNKWRATTLDILKQSPEIRENLDISISELAEATCTTLAALTDVQEPAPKARVSSLTTIVKRFVSLAHTIRVQRARYEFTLPAPQSRLDTSKMEDTSVEEVESESDPHILCATFPTVVKIGDEVGENEHFRNVIFKAKVLRKYV